MTETSSSTARTHAAAATPGTTHIRREVRGLPPGDRTLHWYGKAVAAMRKRHADDPTSWSYQAAIHGTHAPSPKPLWNQCKHGTWYFLAWHRMFVYYFERIVRAAVVEAGGPSDWALPYWNYGLGGQHATLPPAFRQPTVEGAPNPLYVAQRAPGVNAGGMLPPAVTSDAHALSRPHFTGSAEFGGGVTSAGRQFWSETGSLELTPHNVVHSVLGGEDGWMADPDQAAQDPIFWLHHSNIDRIWAVWSARGHADPHDKRWRNQRFHFYDADGTQVSKTSAGVLDTVADLGYTYDPPPAPVSPTARQQPPSVPPPTPPQPRVVGATERPLRLVGATERAPVAIDARAGEEATGEAGGPERRRVFLNVEDIEAEKDPGTVYGLYLNLPEDPDEETLSAHHVGNVSFFGIERAREPREDEHGHGLRVSVEITDLVNELTAQGKWDEQQLHVTFRPLGLIPPEGAPEATMARAKPPGEDPPVHVGRVSLSYA